MNKIVDKIKRYIKIIGRPHGRERFLLITNRKGRLLDVGCGNNSPYYIKLSLPDVFYVGLDIGDYNQQALSYADEYIVTQPETFSKKIAEMPKMFDTIISVHNLEHCNDRWGTLIAMTKALKADGYMYLAFPTEESVNFPSREGTLNYYDDETHKDTPPPYDDTLNILRANNMKIIFSSKSYKPWLFYIMGFLLEPLSRKWRKVPKGFPTWWYWGFECVIWAKKSSEPD
jgi:SAM-dependent methyltransferase